MSIRIVIADDYEIIRAGIRLLLRTREDLEIVGEASDGEELVRLVEETRPDIAIVDINMPGGDGIDATARITEGVAACRVIAMSVHEDPLFVRSMLRAGAMGYMLKDSAAHEIMEAIRHVSAGRYYLSPRIQAQAVEAYMDRGMGADTEVPVDEPLTRLQNEVLRQVAEGLPVKQIAWRMHCSPKTVHYHRDRIKRKTNLRTTADLTKLAIRLGLVAADDGDRRTAAE